MTEYHIDYLNERLAGELAEELLNTSLEYSDGETFDPPGLLMACSSQWIFTLLGRIRELKRQLDKELRPSVEPRNEAEDSAVITIFQDSPHGPKVLWNQTTGAVKVAPDGEWITPSMQLREESTKNYKETEAQRTNRRENEVLLSALEDLDVLWQGVWDGVIGETYHDSYKKRYDSVRHALLRGQNEE